MNKKNLELLGLSEGASADEITAAYGALRAKLLEDRFLAGEEGNNAARMLSKIDAAYSELMSELNEKATSDDSGSSFARVEELIKAGDLAEAQRALDGFNERTAYWHYLQSVVFFRKNWVNESKKQLEIAIQLDPNNDHYKETYKKLIDKINFDSKTADQQYEGQTMSSVPREEQMGGGFCANCLDCCYTYLCLSCFCNTCCR